MTCGAICESQVSSWAHAIVDEEVDKLQSQRAYEEFFQAAQGRTSSLIPIFKTESSYFLVS